MKKVAKFEKVSFERFKNDIMSFFDQPGQDVNMLIHEAYENLKLPKRATNGSAGYDFFAPCQIYIPSGDESIVIPTGIRCKMQPGYVLSVYPRSGLGFKYRVALDNTTGIIDQDYYDADNEGHILIKLHSKVPVPIEAGKAFAQGIFTEFFITEDDDVDEERHGGFGSTSDK